MPDTLREQIAQKMRERDERSLRESADHEIGYDEYLGELADAILPLVEQAIREEREKRVTTAAECLQRLAEKDAALAAIEAGLRAEFANGGTYEGHDVVSAFGEFIEHHAKNERALAEKDAQIAALQAENTRLALERFEDAAGVERKTKFRTAEARKGDK